MDAPSAPPIPCRTGDTSPCAADAPGTAFGACVATGRAGSVVAPEMPLQPGASEPEPDAPALPWPVPLPWGDALGATLHQWQDGRAEVRLALRPEQLNSWQVAHGGVLMSLLDIAMAQAARSRHPHSAGVVTLEMKTSFLQAARGRLRVQAHVLHATATLDFCEAQLFDGDGRLCASASGTFQHLRALPPRRRGAVDSTA